MKILILWLCLISANVNAGLKELLVKISEEGIQLIAQFEGFRQDPYQDVAGVWTIGFGITFYDIHTPVTMADPPITEADAVNLLETNVGLKCASITDLVTVPLTQNQFDALCSFVYNLGFTAFKNSTLLEELNKSNYAGAADEFLLWDHSGGKVVPGLLTRRQAERSLFLKAGKYASTN